MTNSIGSFVFIALYGQPAPPAEQIDRYMVRPGVDGVGLWKTGRRGRVFTMRSVVDQPNLTAAHFTLKAYRGAIGGDRLALVHNGRDYAADSWLVAVLDVRQVRVQAVASSAGGLYPPSLAKLTCEWDLIAIENPT